MKGLAQTPSVWSEYMDGSWRHPAAVGSVSSGKAVSEIYLEYQQFELATELYTVPFSQTLSIVPTHYLRHITELDGLLS